MNAITIYYNNCPHTSRTLTGFYLLGKQYGVSINAIENVDNFRKMSFEILEAELDGKLISFDLGDRWWLAHEDGSEYLKHVDAYFARGYTSDSSMRKESCERNMYKVKPFGFDYYATFAGNPMDKQANGNVKNLLRKASGYSKCMYVPYFEEKANMKKKDLKTLFMTRLWNPGEVNPYESGISDEITEYRKYMIEERKYINAQRMTIIRELKKSYGDNFFGGIYEDDFSRSVCPELILDKAYVRKKAYLDRMKQSDICIGSMGLHQSTGWKTGEYVAASRAIVAERLIYEVPGDFKEGKNYIPFMEVQDCLNAVEELYSDPIRVYEMKKANELYYQQYLKPDQQILNALYLAGIHLG